MIYQYIVYFDIEIDLNINIFHHEINHIKQILIENQMIDLLFANQL